MVAKAHAGERVGVFARRAGRLEVVEYSELHPDQAAATDPRARLGVKETLTRLGHLCT